MTRAQIINDLSICVMRLRLEPERRLPMARVAGFLLKEHCDHEDTKIARFAQMSLKENAPDLYEKWEAEGAIRNDAH